MIGDDWVQNDGVGGGVGVERCCVVSITEESCGTATRDLSYSRSAQRGQCGTVVRFMSVAAVARVLS